VGAAEPEHLPIRPPEPSRAERPPAGPVGDGNVTEASGDGDVPGRGSPGEWAGELRARVARAQAEVLAGHAKTRKLLQDAAQAIARSEELLAQVGQSRELTARQVAEILERVRTRRADRRSGGGTDEGDRGDEQGGRPA
jgi:hypothetical protein